MIYSVKVNQGMFNPNIDSQIELAAQAMLDGKLVAYPTDTVYGVGCASDSDQAIADLYILKDRPHNLKMPLLLSDQSQIAQVAPCIPDSAAFLVDKYWPGPLTIIVQSHPDLNEQIGGGSGTVALRVPNHYVPRKLAKLVGCPIGGTSANKSGEPSCRTYQEVITTIPTGLAFVVNGGDSYIGVESTIVDCTSPEIKIIRQGALDITEDFK